MYVDIAYNKIVIKWENWKYYRPKGRVGDDCNIYLARKDEWMKQVKKKKNQITTRHKRKEKLYLSFTDFTDQIFSISWGLF